MPRALQLAQHLSAETLYHRYRNASDPVERSHWHVIWLKSKGLSSLQIHETTGFSQTWICALIHRYNEHGADGLRDQRHDHPGAEAMLDEVARNELSRLLDDGNAPDGGPWNGPKVARWIEKRTGREHVHDQRGWDYLMRLGFSTKTPRPHHQGADLAKQAAFKK